MATTKKVWTKPVLRKLSRAEVEALAERHESVREMVKKHPWPQPEAV